MTAIVLPFSTAPARPVPQEPPALVIPCQSVEEKDLAAQLLVNCAAPAMDRLQATPAVVKKLGEPYRPIVIVDARGLDVIASADAMRRIAILIEARGRQGAALDLIQAADQAEALAAHMQRTQN